MGHPCGSKIDSNGIPPPVLRTNRTGGGANCTKTATGEGNYIEAPRSRPTNPTPASTPTMLLRAAWTGGVERRGHVSLQQASRTTVRRKGIPTKRWGKGKLLETTKKIQKLQTKTNRRNEEGEIGCSAWCRFYKEVWLRNKDQPPPQPTFYFLAGQCLFLSRVADYVFVACC